MKIDHFQSVVGKKGGFNPSNSPQAIHQEVPEMFVPLSGAICDYISANLLLSQHFAHHKMRKIAFLVDTGFRRKNKNQHQPASRQGVAASPSGASRGNEAKFTMSQR
jgi:hypothetical protein